MSSFDAKRLSRVFAGFVAAGTAIWWPILILYPSTLAPFLWEGFPKAAFYAFIPADAVFIVLIPALYARTGSLMLWRLFSGAFIYGSIFTLALCLILGGGWPGGALMILGSAAILVLNRGMSE